MGTEERVFKVTLNTSKSQPIKVNLNKTSSVLDVKMETSSPPEEIYYDEIIYYDGGGVDGYGD